MNGQDPKNIGNGQNNNNTMNGEGLNTSVLGSVPPTQTPGAVPNIPQPPVPPVNPVPSQNPATPNGGQPESPKPPVTGPTPMTPPPVTPAGPTGPNPVNPPMGQNVGVKNPNGVNPTPTPANQPKPMGPTIVNPAGQPVNQGATVTPANTQPQAQPIPGTMPNNNNGSTQTTGVDPVLTANVNGFVEPNKAENIGTVPPTPETKQKKPMNKVIFVLLILALIAGVAYGVYTFLGKSKTKVTFAPNNYSISVGETPSTNPADYVTITGTSPANCNVNPANIDSTTMGSYDYTVTCGTETYTGKVEVKDGEAPVVQLKVVYTTTDADKKVAVEDFVESCEDPSKCTVEFADETSVATNLQTAGGPYNIDIIAKDGNDNQTTVQGVMYVLPSELRNFMVCSAPEEDMTENKGKKTVSDKLTIGFAATTLEYLDAGRREYTYVFEDKEEYNTVIGKKESTITYDGNTGLATYDDAALTLTISTDLDMETLNKEANGTFAKNYVDIKAYYEGKGYTCQNVLP